MTYWVFNGRGCLWPTMLPKNRLKVRTDLCPSLEPIPGSARPCFSPNSYVSYLCDAENSCLLSGATLQHFPWSLPSPIIRSWAI